MTWVQELTLDVCGAEALPCDRILCKDTVIVSEVAARILLRAFKVANKELLYTALIAVSVTIEEYERF